MGKPSHKSYKLYRAVIGHAGKDGETIAMDNRQAIAVDVKDALAQMTDLDANEYVSELHIITDLDDGLRFPDPN